MDTAVKPQGCTNLKLRQLMRRVAAHYDAEVGKTGLKGTQYSLLSYVLKLGPFGGSHQAGTPLLTWSVVYLALVLTVAVAAFSARAL